MPTRGKDAFSKGALLARPLGAVLASSQMPPSPRGSSGQLRAPPHFTSKPQARLSPRAGGAVARGPAAASLPSHLATHGATGTHSLVFVHACMSLGTCVSVGVCVSLGVLTATWWKVARTREDPGPESPWPRPPPTRVAH